MRLEQRDNEESRSRQVKAAQNQSLFREVNERVKEIGEHLGSMSYAENAICECADPECSDQIALEAEEYESLRQHSTFFAVAPSDKHVFADVERIVEKREHLVEKIERAAVVAEKLDPRKGERPT